MVDGVKLLHDRGKLYKACELFSSIASRCFTGSFYSVFLLLCVLFIADNARAVTLKEADNRAQAWFNNNQVPQFILVIDKQEVIVEKLSESKVQGGKGSNYRLTLKQLPEKLNYALYTEPVQLGYVETQAVMSQWQESVSQGRISLVVAKISGI